MTFPSLTSSSTFVKSAKQWRRTSAPENTLSSQAIISAFPMSSGGIKDSDDLKKLNLIGVKGCLIATALHQKKITKKDLDSFFLSAKKMPRYSRH